MVGALYQGLSQDLDDNELEYFYCDKKGYIHYQCIKFKSELINIKEKMKNKRFMRKPTQLKEKYF